ncbi:hypothetical protein E4U43_004634 [Claviceps pusilla]|uniref:Serine hydrolase domain-containing protein n=1 Tax=Claviceps pusilla TaxID=123648 RepID=A0A9P7N5W0_9HYPO|nr:hypothetical protein E4U43_004634 [Claviceps pusilla]
MGQLRALDASEDNGRAKALLCIHGSGSSADIFSIQLARLRTALAAEYDFVFANGPHDAAPGPGILPWFRGAGPYQSWFREQDATMEQRIEQINAPLRSRIETWNRTKTNPSARIVGILAFSEGALVATLLLWQQQMGRVPWLPRVHFAVLMCCYFRAEAGEYMGSNVDAGEAIIRVPTLHVHGKQDFCLAGARRLVSDHYSPGYAQVMEFDGTHHPPMKRTDIESVAKYMQLRGRMITDHPNAA